MGLYTHALTAGVHSHSPDSTPDEPGLSHVRATVHIPEGDPMTDHGFTVAWGALTCAGIALEAAALRRPKHKSSGTLSAHVWRLLGQRYGWRWQAGAAVWLLLGAHFLFRWPR